MAEASVENVEVSEESFLKKFGFETAEQAETVFSKYKEDLKSLKGKAKTAEDLQAKLEAYELAAEDKRKSELGEVERLKETLDEKDKAVESVRSELENMKKTMVFKDVMFEHMKEKSLSKTRSKLYEIAVKSNEWTTTEELQEILDGVDKDFDSEIEASGIKLPAPGDGNSAGNRTGGTKYDEGYFKNLNKR